MAWMFQEWLLGHTDDFIYVTGCVGRSWREGDVGEVMG